MIVEQVHFPSAVNDTCIQLPSPPRVEFVRLLGLGWERKVGGEGDMRLFFAWSMVDAYRRMQVKGSAKD
jgi:hypothetical protein